MRLICILLAAITCSCATSKPPTPPGGVKKVRMRAAASDAAAVVVVPPLAVVSQVTLAWDIVGPAAETGLEQSNSPTGPWSVVASHPVTGWPSTHTATTTVTNQAFWRAFSK